ncbi:DUF2642 domain-containing protein [Sporosarcina sp. ACRSL]|uniref:DUF2642 domain-containing protein n=1 Tax=Sporosarcina sp. ACRSL TaxID=2918215 RepID=UPI001EF5CC88|nr:DUF2642 domain-containing protein [Sporosarcina sp. ACRSL]MCG7346014.1 DUF2642 domain-containing protein [Sporosarcina sp. ACRSL]
MNKIIQSLVQEVVRIEITGKKMVNGTLIDVGSDMIVLFNGMDFVYIPLDHIRNFVRDIDNENNVQAPTELPSIVAEESQEDLSFEYVLTQAKGRLIEIFVSGNQSLHGTITAILKDYLVFQSPIYKTLYIPLAHIKWLIPLAQDHKLYGSEIDFSSTESPNETFASSFEKQVEKLVNKLVVMNISERESFIGKIINVEEHITEFQAARTSPFYLNLRHIKTLHEV